MKRVLIVDDDPAIRDGLTSLLQLYGFEVDAAADGDEAFARLSDRGADLMLLDIFMPNRDGLELLMGLGKKREGLKIIATTGRADEAFDPLRVAQEFGAHRVLAKPFETMELLDAIAGLIGPLDGADPTYRT